MGGHFEGTTCRIAKGFDVEGERILYLQLEKLTGVGGGGRGMAGQGGEIYQDS